MPKLFDLLGIACDEYHGFHQDFYDGVMELPIELDLEGEAVFKRYGGNKYYILEKQYGNKLRVNSYMPMTEEQAVELMEILVKHSDVFIDKNQNPKFQELMTRWREVSDNAEKVVDGLMDILLKVKALEDEREQEL